jgi:DNA primase
MEDIVEKLKGTVKIEQIIEADGYHLAKRGRYWTCQEHDSLVVDVGDQAYHWNSKDEHGDVINWVEKRRSTDFKGAVEELCRRSNLPLPEWGKQDAQVRIAARAKEDAFEVAAKVFQAWLERDPKALEYSRGRGWSEEVARQHHLGYSGSGTAEERKEMTGELSLAGVDLKSPAAIAIMGLKGGVAKWAADHQVDLSQYKDWIEKDHIPGLIGHEGLIYPHIRSGRVKYFSRRGIKEKFHYNLPLPLVGNRQPFFNSAYSSSATKVIVVEGPADAITLAQWGFAAVALQGTYWDKGFADFISNRIEGKKKNEIEDDLHVFIGLDSDKAGEASLWKNADLFGPMVRFIHWPEVKDANDLLKELIAIGRDHKQQVDSVTLLITKCLTYVEEYCDWVGRQEGADKETALKSAYKLITRMSDTERGIYQKNLSDRMKINQQELKRVVKAMLGDKKEDKKDRNTTYTRGGVIDGWLVELTYDPEDDSTCLAWRDPEGHIDTGRTVQINKTVYEAFPADEAMIKGAIQFPSKLGEKMVTGELVKYIEAYVRKNYLLAKDLDVKIMSYYPVLTWLYQSFNAIPYLRAMGDAGAGKSELLRRLGLLCYRTLTSNGCGTEAVLFRTIEKYHGTMFIDEADLKDSSTNNPIVKLMNLGAMKGNFISREKEVTNEDGSKGHDEEYFDSFCPKLIAMRKDYKDDAVGSRCLTFKVDARSTRELVKNNIPLEVDNEMRARALSLRNLLLRWKLEHWQQEIKINPIFYDLDISPRLNQVTGALMALSQDDPELQKEMRLFLRDYYNDMVKGKSMTITARVLEAMWQIYKFPDLRKQYIVVEPDGSEKFLVGSITTIANQIVDTMNANDGGEDEDDSQSHRKKKEKAMTSQSIGALLRETLHLKIGNRTKLGFYVYWDQERMEDLSKQYGIDPNESGPDTKSPTNPVEKTAKPVQPKLPDVQGVN